MKAIAYAGFRSRSFEQHAKVPWEPKVQKIFSRAASGNFGKDKLLEDKKI
jgi:hypothetical protein